MNSGERCGGGRSRARQARIDGQVDAIHLAFTANCAAERRGRVAHGLDNGRDKGVSLDLVRRPNQMLHRDVLLEELPLFVVQRLRCG